jgi:hypothetical protein
MTLPLKTGLPHKIYRGLHRHRFDADPDPDRLSISMPIQIQILLQMFTHAGKSYFFYLYSKQCQSTLFCFSRQHHTVGYIDNFGQLQCIKIFWKKYSLALHSIEMDK